jgi:hypothetical protein
MQIARIDPMTGVFDIISGVVQKGEPAPAPLFSRTTIIWPDGPSAYAIDDGSLFSINKNSMAVVELADLPSEVELVNRRASYSVGAANLLVFTQHFAYLVNVNSGAVTSFRSGADNINRRTTPATYSASDHLIYRQTEDKSTDKEDYLIDSVNILTGTITPLGVLDIPQNIARDYDGVSQIYRYSGNELYLEAFERASFLFGGRRYPLLFNLNTGAESELNASAPQNVLSLIGSNYLVESEYNDDNRRLYLYDPVNTEEVKTIFNHPNFSSLTDNKHFVSNTRIINDGTNYITEFSVHTVDDDFTTFTSVTYRIPQNIAVVPDAVRGTGPLFNDRAYDVVSIVIEETNRDLYVLTRKRLWKVDIQSGDREIIAEYAEEFYYGNDGLRVQLNGILRPPSVNDYVNALSNIAPLPPDTITPDRNEDGTLDVGDLTTRQIEVQRLP